MLFVSGLTDIETVNILNVNIENEQLGKQ